MADEMSIPASPAGEIKTIVHQIYEKGILRDERNNRYDNISDIYEKTYIENNYKGPYVAAQTTASLYSSDQRSDISILEKGGDLQQHLVAASTDIGAGTGLVAYELGRLGFQTIDGLDASQCMLDKAKQKGIYRNLYWAEITSEPLNILKDSYDVITVVGSHGPNHIMGEAVKEMIRLVKQNGYIIIVSRVEHYKVEDYKTFFPMCESLESEGKWKQIKRETCPYFPGIEGLCLCNQKC